MAHTQNHIETLGGNQGAFEQFVQQRLRQAVRVALISVLEEEVSVFIGALPYERTQQRCDQRNGHYTRDLEACLTFYAFPKEHWKTIRTNNVMERLEGSVKRRSHKMAAAFRNEESCLLLFYAVIRGLKLNKLTIATSSEANPPAGSKGS